MSVKSETCTEKQFEAEAAERDAQWALASGQAEDIAHAYLMLQELLAACTCDAKQKVLDKYPEARAAEVSAEAQKRRELGR